MSKSKPSKLPVQAPRAKAPRHAGEAPARPLRDRNLAATNPLTEQFEPTPAEPIRQHARMAGY